MKRRTTESNKKRNVTLMGVLLVAIMVFSMMAVMRGGGGSTLEYNGFKFKYDENAGMLSLKINKQDVPFSFFPDTTEDLEVPAEAVTLFQNTPGIYMTFDPDQTEYLRLFDVFRLDFTTHSGKNIIGATTKNSDLYNFPIMTCEDADSTNPVIYLKVGNQTGITFYNSCIIFEANDIRDFVKIRDRFYYAIFGVI
jgi:hypothetical protein